MKILYRLGLISSLASQLLLANIPEPDIVFYGKIIAKVGALEVPIQEGLLTWDIKSDTQNDKNYHFETKLESLSNGMYSYSLKVPQQIVVNIDTLMQKNINTLSLDEKKELLFKHFNIMVNGEKALLRNDSLRSFSAGQEQRSSYAQIDLEVSSKSLGADLDTNNNGVPDVWENFYNITDIDGDKDGDGWSNKEEYEQNTNPDVNNKISLLSSDSNIALNKLDKIKLDIYENGRTQVRLNVVDSDSNDDELDITLDSIPDDVVFFLSNDLENPLEEGTTLSASDINNIGLIVEHKPLKLLDENNLPIVIAPFELTLMDNGPLQVSTDNNDSNQSNTPVTYSIELSTVNILSIAEPTRWIDAKVSTNTIVQEIKGRSGYASDIISTYNYNAASQTFLNTQENISIDKQGMMSVSDTEDLLGFPSSENNVDNLNLLGNHSLFFVSQSIKEKSTLFNDGYINVEIDGDAVEFAINNSETYIRSTLKEEGDTLIFSIHNENNTTKFDINTIPVGSTPHTLDDESTHSPSSIAGFGFAEGAYGSTDGFVYPFSGKIGEFVVFPDVLNNANKWRVNAYLLSKWKNYVIYDSSKSVIPSRIEVSPDLQQATLLLGGINDDVLFGGPSDDILVGGLGSDSLTGGEGNDRFIIGDGDIVKDFTYEYGSEVKQDVINVDELLINGVQPLNQCLFFQPKNGTTLVKINSTCEGKDYKSGADFNDASFTIEGQGLWNSDMPILWMSGALYTGGHQPNNLEIKITINNKSSLDIVENQVNNKVFYIDISYNNANPYQGKDLEIPLDIISTGTHNKDYTLTIDRYIDINNSHEIEKITQNLYHNFDQLLELSTEEVKSFNITIDREHSTFIHASDLLLDNSTKKLSIPNLLDENGSIKLKLTILHDKIKESDESIKLVLKDVPEYYTLSKEHHEVTINITDGLDEISIKAQEQKVYEGDDVLIQVHRNGSIDVPLSVNLELSGVASEGSDFGVFNRTVVFSIGEETKDIVISTQKDSIKEAIESFTIKIMENDSYTIDQNSDKTIVYIHDLSENFLDQDNDGLLDSWEIENGLNPLVSNILSNPNDTTLIYKDSDGDGLNDREEFYAGLNPQEIDSDNDGVLDSLDIAPLNAKISSESDINGYQIISIPMQDEIINAPYKSDAVIALPVKYSTSTGVNKLGGLTLTIHYNSQQVEYLGLDDLLTQGYSSTVEKQDDIFRGDYKLYTDSITITWNSDDNSWPNMPLNTKLFTAKFKLKDTLKVGEQSVISIDGEESVSQYMVKPIYQVIKIIEGSGLEYVNNLNSSDNKESITSIIKHLLKTPLAPEENSLDDYIKKSGLLFDIDGDGVVNPLIDIVILSKYESYISGDNLTDLDLLKSEIESLVSKNATRKTFSELKASIERILESE